MALAPGTIEVLDPTAKARVQETLFAERLPQLDGKVVGFVDNSKPNADIFLARVGELLSAKYRLKDTVWVAKRSAAAPLHEDQLALLKERCDLVINAWGD